MHLTKVSLTNIRSIRELEWSVDPAAAAGWHVIVGDNGSGKSSFLRALVLGLLAGRVWGPLRLVASDWVTTGATEAKVRVEISGDRQYDEDPRPGQTPALNHWGTFKIDASGQTGLEADDISFTRRFKRSGWFSAGYGPFRRFAGGDLDYERQLEQLPELARHVSLFEEKAALTESLAWLKDLKFKSLEKDARGDLLEPLLAFVNSGELLPHGVKLEEITSSDITFVDGSGSRVPIQQLSDGYRSVLSLTLDLLRHLTIAYGPERLFDSKEPSRIDCPGVVVIDEVDVHLHPTWQRSIGLFFRRHFPKVQFIVSSHSPLVCQAAEHGTVFRLPRPSDEESPGMITGVELERLLYGSVLDAYGTEIFGRGVTRSDKSLEYLTELADLNQKEIQGRLSPEERRKQQHLRKVLPSNAYDRDHPETGASNGKP